MSIIPSVSPAGPPNGNLAGVSCATPTDCVAVGGDSKGTLIERWDGSSWRFAASANPKGGVEPSLSAVTCTSTTNCVAVGSSATTGPSFSSVTLIEHWDGTKWSVVPSAAPAGIPLAVLTTVSCSSATNCVAVGIDAKSDAGANTTLAEHWNGKTWTILPTPSVSGSLDTELVGVACRSAQSCTAGGKTLVEHWNGTTLSIVPSPSPAARSNTALTGVSCPTPAGCTAVGAYNSRSGSFTLTEQGS